jgi:hypothetical protein
MISGNNMFTVLDGTDDPLFIDDLMQDGLDTGTDYGLDHIGRRPLIIRDSRFDHMRVRTGAGPTWIEDTWTGLYMEAGTKVYARQLNMEAQTSTVRVENHGGDLAVLGFKTERSSTVCTTTDGGRTEILGGFLYWTTTSNGTPAFVNTDSEHTLSFMCTAIQLKNRRR